MPAKKVKVTICYKCAYMANGAICTHPDKPYMDFVKGIQWEACSKINTDGKCKLFKEND